MFFRLNNSFHFIFVFRLIIEKHAFNMERRALPLKGFDILFWTLDSVAIKILMK